MALREATILLIWSDRKQPPVGAEYYGQKTGSCLAKGGVPPGWGQGTPGFWPGSVGGQDNRSCCRSGGSG